MRCVVASGLGSDPTSHLVSVTVHPRQSSGVKRPPIDLALVVDRSSSMVGPRIAAAVEAVRQICLRLNSDDRLSVVAFDGQALTVRAPGPAGEGTAAEVAIALAEKGVGYGTNIADGWQKAAKLLSRGGIPLASRTILLLTDGLPSRGLLRSAELATLLETGGASGIITSTVGIGERFDEKLLTKMAHAGGGSFRFVEKEDHTVTVAEEEVEGLTHLAAEEAVLHFGFGRSVKHYELLHDMPCQIEEDGIAVELGRLFAGNPRSVVVEVTAEPQVPLLGAVALSCVERGGEPQEVKPERILLPAPGQQENDAAEVGAAYVPLVVARWQQKVWDRGRDASHEGIRDVVRLAREGLSALPEVLCQRDEAQDALRRFDAMVSSILEILEDKQASEEQRRSYTEITLKGLAEDTSNTVLGMSPSGRPRRGRRKKRGWGK